MSMRITKPLVAPPPPPTQKMSSTNPHIPAVCHINFKHTEKKLDAVESYLCENPPTHLKTDQFYKEKVRAARQGAQAEAASLFVFCCETVTQIKSGNDKPLKEGDFTKVIRSFDALPGKFMQTIVLPQNQIKKDQEVREKINAPPLLNYID